MSSDALLLLIGGVLLLILVAISLVDFRRYVIPDYLTGALALAGVLAMWVLAVPAGWDAMAGLIAGGGVSLGLRTTYQRLRGVTGLGLGDVKLLAASGLWVGLLGLPWLMLMAACSGLLFMIGLRVLGGQVNAQTRIAFGPHLALALFVTWICKMQGML